MSSNTIEQKILRRLLLPAKFYQPSIWGTILFILYALCLYMVPAWLCYEIATNIESLFVKILLVLPLTIIAGYGIQLLGFVGHDGFHLSLHSNKLVSVLIGLFFASAVPTYFDVGAMMRHWSHHRFTNQSSDPDVKLLAPLKTWWQRLFFARILLNYNHFKTTVDTALGRPWPFPYMMPFAFSTIRVLCWVNFVFSLIWMSLYLGVAVYYPTAGIYCILFPTIAMGLISGCQSYIDHGGIKNDPDDLLNSWIRTSWIETLLWCGSNFHLEHHLYPGVPCYRLPGVHQYLKDNGFYEKFDLKISPDIIDSYRKLDYVYDGASWDSTFDPHQHAIEHASI